LRQTLNEPRENLEFLMYRLPRHSLFRSLCTVFLFVLILARAQAFCCGNDHAQGAQDNPIECECVCACLCHSTTITSHDDSPVLVPRLSPCKHLIIDEEASSSAFVLGIDHPPEI
jgi:hypothetical protein